MESAEATVKPVALKVNWVIHTTPASIKPATTPFGSGWWVQFEGSRESLFFPDPCPFSPGDRVKITFEKI